jgi:dimethylargininase
MRFSGAIVREVPATLSGGITSAGLGSPDYDLARRQHERYVRALEAGGLEVNSLAADERFPDSVFIEDTAVVTGACAVITNPGARSRRGETGAVYRLLSTRYERVERIEPPGTLDGGDVLQVEDHFYIGLTRRTNPAGAGQLAGHLERHGFGSSTVPVSGLLHLKTGVSYLGDGNLLVLPELAEAEGFRRFNRIAVPPEESYCANCLRVNDRVIFPRGHERTAEALSGLGYELAELDVSEFRKLDGGLSCLSLRLP